MSGAPAAGAPGAPRPPAGGGAPRVRRVVLTGGLVVDGTGQPGRLADVDVVGGQVAQIAPAGSLRHADADLVEDASGLVVCPGFIDPHSHSDESPLQVPDDTSKILQGITTDR
ncbi:MAG: hypothetical protein M0Z40_09385, partial [Actinomycetota bacterium]|nr:hypothetical protein [Actinomycetota bacterium]